ncbi:MAG: Na/Pi cotransporter family protein [Rhizobiales bacterium]|nr:Na/Pi cotransporter family protein [Hyphomicrobiales bacterium]
MELLITLAGYVALLVWGIRMIRTGVTRSFLAPMRRVLAIGTRGRLRAFLSGLGVTVILQSSTATGMVLSSFAGRGLVTLATAIAVMLGADVGTALAAFVFSMKISWLPPLLLALGVIGFLGSGSDKRRNLGRIAIGLGLALLSLGLIGEASAGLRQSETLTKLLEVADGQPVIAAVIGALVAWLAHSSLSVVILLMSLTAAGLVSLPLAAALVIGANIGGSLAPVIAQMGLDPTVRRVLVANLMMRTSMAVVVLAVFLAPATALLAWLVPNPGTDVLVFHAAFNLATAALFLPLVGPVAWLATRLLPDRLAAPDLGKPRYLDATVIASPSEAIACATRETLRLGDLVAEMLSLSIDVFRRDDQQLLKQVEHIDDDIDKLYEAIKLYLVKASGAEMSEEESRRHAELLTFVTNLEHVGDIIDKNLMELAAKKIRNRYTFSDEGLAELQRFHERVQQNLKLSFNVLTMQDLALARRLLAEKLIVRDFERQASESHFARLRAGRPESIETSGIHLDIIRDLKRINSHLTSVAYPILEAHGELLDSRLKESEEMPTRAPASGWLATPGGSAST